MKPLLELRESLKAQIAGLTQQLEGVEMAIRAMSGERIPSVSTGRSRGVSRINVKQYLLDLLAKRADLGLNASLAVEIAEKEGHKIERATVSSLLSRFKAENLVAYDGEFYRPQKVKAASEQSKPGDAPAVH